MIEPFLRFFFWGVYIAMSSICLDGVVADVNGSQPRGVVNLIAAATWLWTVQPMHLNL